MSSQHSGPATVHATLDPVLGRQEPPQDRDSTKKKRRRTKSAGGILIDPWGDILNIDRYKVLIVNQRVGQYWGLPKGHVEPQEDADIYQSALRELKEETGVDLNRMRHGIDYMPVRLRESARFYNHIVIKKIHFFVWVLLCKSASVPCSAFDAQEIRDTMWMNAGTAEHAAAQGCALQPHAFGDVATDFAQRV